MINWKLIYKVLGQLLFIEASLLLLSLLVAVYYQQEDIFAFIVATLTTNASGIAETALLPLGSAQRCKARTHSLPQVCCRS